MYGRLGPSSLFALSLLLAVPLAHADRLLMDVIQAERQADTLPRNGQTMEQVKSRFGDPEERVAPVGSPPISRWKYSDYTVYFEYDLVIHTVPRR